MSKAKENMIIIRHGRTRRTRSLTNGRKVLILLTSGINRSNHPKLRSSQLEWWEKSQEIHNRIENHSNVGNMEDPTYAGIAHLNMGMQGHLTTFKRKK